MDEPRCPHCDAAMPAGTEVCPACGKKGTPQHTPLGVEGESGLFYCYRHKSETTRLRCGRCGRAVCTRCVMIGPAGPRCRECGRSKVPVSARAIAHEARMSLRGLLGGPLRFVLIILAFSLLWGTVRGCAAMLTPQRVAPIQERPTPNEE